MSNLFNTFCSHVDKTIFSKENVGECVAFIIDQAFIDDFCKKYSVTEKSLMHDVMLNLSRPAYSGHLHVKGILAIQLFAATKREDSRGITERNYRDRLCQVLDWDMNELQSWMSENQDDYWNSLYSWCSVNDFKIVRSEPKTGHGRYVQYPIQQAERVFTQKDLKYIAFHFVQKGLKPEEDIKESDFWKILSKRSVSHYVHTNHGRRLIENPDYLPDAFQQIFNYYLRWDGSYIDINRSRTATVEKVKNFLYLSEDGYLDIRDENWGKKERLQWNEIQQQSLDGLYSFKRNHIIIFKHSEDYSGYWEETRYLEDKEPGIAVVFEGISSSYYSSPYSKLQSFFSHLIPVFQSNRVKVYRFDYSSNVASLYTEKKFFSLEGGLKIGRMRFMEGGAPLLVMEKNSKFWIDGEEPPLKPIAGVLSLNFLKAGNHDIKFPNFKKIEFTIIRFQPSITPWNASNNSWVLSKDSQKWESLQSDTGIIGIDYSCIKMDSSKNTGTSVLTRWAVFHSTGRVIPDENNIAIRILNK